MPQPQKNMAQMENNNWEEDLLEAHINNLYKQNAPAVGFCSSQFLCSTC